MPSFVIDDAVTPEGGGLEFEGEGLPEPPQAARLSIASRPQDKIATVRFRMVVNARRVAARPS